MHDLHWHSSLKRRPSSSEMVSSLRLCSNGGPLLDTFSGANHCSRRLAMTDYSEVQRGERMSSPQRDDGSTTLKGGPLGYDRRKSVVSVVLQRKAR